MEPPRREIDGASIFFVGKFNPAILQPAWLAAEGLVSAAEADAAALQVIHPDVTVFSTELFEIQATREQFLAVTSRAPLQMLADLVIGIFDRLSHTPVGNLGMNRDSHYKMRSVEEWHAIGYKLLPPELWRDVLTDPGMRAAVVTSVRVDGLRGAVNVQVEPSYKVTPHGVFIQVNDQVQVAHEPSREGCAEAVRILREQWVASMERADAIQRHVFEWEHPVS